MNLSKELSSPLAGARTAQVQAPESLFELIIGIAYRNDQKSVCPGDTLMIARELENGV